MKESFDLNPPEAEFAPEDAYACTECGDLEVDPYSEPRHEVDGLDVCQACVCMCTLCGEYLDDEQAVENGPAVKVREWANDGKFQFVHALCGAEAIAEDFNLEARDARVN